MKTASTPGQSDHDIDSLRSTAKEVQARILRISEKKEIDRLIEEILARNGWSTPSEFLLVGHALESLIIQLDSVDRQIDFVVRDADTVGR
jgi:hypothetical protein